MVYTLHGSLEAGKRGVQPDDVMAGGRLRGTVESGNSAAVEEDFDLSVSNATLLSHHVVHPNKCIILYQPLSPDSMSIYMHIICAFRWQKREKR